MDSEIPRQCRLVEAVKDTLAWCRESSDWEDVWEKIHEKYGHYSGVHTINNAALVVMGLCFGANDYEKGIVVTVRGGWDTDCTGATVGSILGAKFGADALPEKWVGVLNDRLMSCVRDCNDNRISELAERTHRVASAILSPHVEEAASEPIAVGDGGLPGTWKVDLEWGNLVLNVDDDLSAGSISRPSAKPGRYATSASREARFASDSACRRAITTWTSSSRARCAATASQAFAPAPASSSR